MLYSNGGSHLHRLPKMKDLLMSRRPRFDVVSSLKRKIKVVPLLGRDHLIFFMEPENRHPKYGCHRPPISHVG